MLGLVGDNGAGKSTFLKILCGFLRPDSGRIILDGNKVEFRLGPRRSPPRRRSTLPGPCPDTSAHRLPEPLPQPGADIRRVVLLRPDPQDAQVGPSVPRRVDEKVNLPSIDAEVEWLSAVNARRSQWDAATRETVRVLLLDEPLAAMGAKESNFIIDLVHDLAATGEVSIIVIDHNYAHLFELCHRVNVVEDGKVTHDKIVGDTSIEELTELMVSEYRRQVTTGRNQLAGRPSGRADAMLGSPVGRGSQGRTGRRRQPGHGSLGPVSWQGDNEDARQEARPGMRASTGGCACLSAHLPTQGTTSCVLSAASCGMTARRRPHGRMAAWP